MSATITKLAVDATNEKLLILATSSGETTESGVTHYHKFTNIYIDTTQTFNCNNSPSSNAVTIALDLDFNENLHSSESTDSSEIPYEVPFSDILSNDVANDIVFVWIEETDYYPQEYSGYYYNNNYYLTDKNNSYYVVSSLAENAVLSASTETDYNAAAASADENHTITTYVNGDTMYIHHEDSSESTETYFTQDMTSLSTGLETSTESDYLDEDNRFIADDDVPPCLFGVTLSVRFLYELILDKINIKNENDCNANCSDVNFMLAWNGFNLAKNLGEYKQMIYYWRLLHQVSSSSTSGCGCS